VICYPCSIGKHLECYSKEYHYGDRCRCCGMTPFYAPPKAVAAPQPRAEGAA
jgi:hypothetical protein